MIKSVQYEKAVKEGKVCAMCFRWIDRPAPGHPRVCLLCSNQMQFAYDQGVTIAPKRRWKLKGDKKDERCTRNY